MSNKNMNVIKSLFGIVGFILTFGIALISFGIWLLTKKHDNEIDKKYNLATGIVLILFGLFVVISLYSRVDYR